MPRTLQKSRYRRRIYEKTQRRPTGVIAGWRASGGPIEFIDYFPDIPGTIPEKMLFMELVNRQINFKYNWFFGDFYGTPEVKERIRPDFLLFDYKIVIEVNGVYWHTRPGAFEHDAVRAAMLELVGFKVYVLTDLEILNDVGAALDSIPEVANGNMHGNQFLVGDIPFDPLKGLRSRLTKGVKVFSPVWRGKYGLKRNERVKQAWKGANAPPARPLAVSPLFRGFWPRTGVIEPYDPIENENNGYY